VPDEQTPHHVLVVGEALMDVVSSPAGELAYPGGSPMNIAYGLARLGHPVDLLTRVGRDEYGTRILDHLRSAGVTVLPASVVDAPTSTARATIDDEGVASYEFDIVWALPGMDAGTSDAAGAPGAVGAPGTVGGPGAPGIVHTGSIGSVLEPGAGRVRDVLAACPDALVSFDPNVRPAIMGAHDDVLPVVERLAATAHVVKLSDEDASWLYPAFTPEQTVAHLLGLGPAVVAMTLGGDGCLIASARDALRRSAFATTVVDTIGAGDSFMSGMLDAIIRSGLVDTIRAGEVTAEDLGRIADGGLASAAVTVSRAGANPPTRAELAAAAPGGAAS
jgi:fructokinase